MPTSNMTLNACGGEKISNPTNRQIRRALESLNVAKNGEGFVILGPDDMNYVQASGDKKIGFDLEYQEADTGHHYRAKRENFTVEEVLSALSNYRDGKPAWKAVAEWEKITW